MCKHEPNNGMLNPMAKSVIIQCVCVVVCILLFLCCSLCTLINVLSLDIITDRLAKVCEAGQLRNLYGVWYE